MLTPNDRGRVLDDLLNDSSPQRNGFTNESLFPSIVKTPDVCGGSARLVRTRIPVWTLERMKQLGLDEIELLRHFPTLQRMDLLQAWRYVANHRTEVEREIQENERE